MKLLTTSQLLLKKVGGYEVAGVWLKDLQSLIKETNSLRKENKALKKEIEELEAKLTVVNDMIFIDLKA